MNNKKLDEYAMAPSDEHECEAVLHDIFEGLGFAPFDPESGELGTDDIQDSLAAFAGCKVRTFRDAGLMTQNQGIVITTRDGVEFQLTIKS